jgi:fibronectin type 3 domain-containing protein
MRFLKQLVSGIALVALTAFGLTGCGGGGGGGSSTTTPTPAPAAPAGVVATGGNAQVTLTWQSVTGATSYNIYWANASGVTKTSVNKIIISDPSATSYLHQNLLSGAKYYYIVTAVNAKGESVASSEANGTTAALPAGPAELSATPLANSVTLNWTAVANATGYKIYRTLSAGVNVSANTNLVATVTDGSTVTYLDNGATVGDSYYYKVTAIVNGTDTLPSYEMSATPSANPAPAAPIGVSATAYNMSGAEQINILWTPVNGATSYKIYQSTDKGVTTSSTLVTGVTPAPDGNGNMLVRINVSNPITNYYVVTAVNGNGESAISKEVIAVPPTFTDEMIAGKTVTYTDDGGGSFTFNCSANKTMTITNSTLTGVPANATGTWSTDGGTLTVAITTDSYNYVIYNISGNGSILRVSFAKGSQALQTGGIVIS